VSPSGRTPLPPSMKIQIFPTDFTTGSMYTGWHWGVFLSLLEECTSLSQAVDKGSFADGDRLPKKRNTGFVNLNI